MGTPAELDVLADRVWGVCDWKRRPSEWQVLGRGLEEGRGYSQETRKAIRCSDGRQKRFPARRRVLTDREDGGVGW